MVRSPILQDKVHIIRSGAKQRPFPHFNSACLPTSISAKMTYFGGKIRCFHTTGFDFEHSYGVKASNLEKRTIRGRIERFSRQGIQMWKTAEKTHSLISLSARHVFADLPLLPNHVAARRHAKSNQTYLSRYPTPSDTSARAVTFGLDIIEDLKNVHHVCKAEPPRVWFFDGHFVFATCYISAALGQFCVSRWRRPGTRLTKTYWNLRTQRLNVSSSSKINTRSSQTNLRYTQPLPPHRYPVIPIATLIFDHSNTYTIFLERWTVH